MSGRLKPVGSRRPRVGPRQVAYDLKFLLAVLNWATLSRGYGGEPLLGRNPLKGLTLPADPSPQRPVLSDEEYQALLHMAGEVDWRFELALVLAHETGHRIGAIRQLRWEDVDLERGRIRWRGAADKIGFEHTAPASARASEALGAAGGADPGVWVLPSPMDPSRPCSRHVLRDWWSLGVKKAKLPPIRRRGWHSLRRKFATELKGVPLKDLCQLGGWKSHLTVLKCYQQADEDTMRRALEGRRALA